MLRKVTGIIALIAIIASTIPALAAQGSSQEKEKPLWQIISDSFKDVKVREQDKVKGVEKITIFQEISDGIKKGSATAKNQSLRGK